MVVVSFIFQTDPLCVAVISNSNENNRQGPTGVPLGCISYTNVHVQCKVMISVVCKHLTV